MRRTEIPVEIQIREPITIGDHTDLNQRISVLRLNPNEFNKFVDGELPIQENMIQCQCGLWKNQYSICLHCKKV